MEPEPAETANGVRRRNPLAEPSISNFVCSAETRDGQTSLPLAAVLSVCPVAVLRGVERGDAPTD